MAVSFVRQAADIIELKNILKNRANIKVIAKIETQEAIEMIDGNNCRGRWNIGGAGRFGR